MASGFASTGVTVTEIASPPIAPGTGFPTVLALVGTAQGAAPFTERVVLSGILTSLLTQTGVVTNSIVVKSNASLQTISGGHYVVAQASDPDGIAADGDETFTIRRIAQPPTAATIAAGAAGTITASVGVVYAIAFSNANGETGLGPDSNSIVVSSKQIGLTGIPISSDGSVTSRKVYRKVSAPDGDGLYHLVTTINDNSSTTYTDNLSEATAEAAKTQEATVNSGDTVIVSYNYTDLSYYKPQIFDDYNALANRYGAPFNTSTGAINSDLSFGALMAFANGAQEVMTVPSKTSGVNDFTTAFATLADQESVAYVVPISGLASVHTAAEAHCTAMNSQGFYRSCIVGRDGSTATILPATLRAAAQAFNDENVTLVSPAAFEISNPVSGATSVIGAHYVAPAVAGMLAARDPQIPLTRKTVAYVTDVHDFRTNADKALDEQAGLFVIENKGGVIRCRHSLTTAAGNVNTREQSVVRVKHEIARALGLILDPALVGTVIPVTAISRHVNGLVEGILNTFVVNQMINSFSNVSSRPTDDPTIIEVRFMFTPMYPTNGVSVGFTIDALNGTVTTQ